MTRPAGSGSSRRRDDSPALVNTIPSPNGIVVDPEESFLLVAVTRANQIWRVPLPASGLITKVGIFSHLHGGPGGPDGLALDDEGNLLVCHTGFGSIWRLSPVAEPLDRIVSCAGVGTTNLAFGGPERRSLFITESRTGTLLRAELETPGLPMFSHAELGFSRRAGRPASLRAGWGRTCPSMIFDLRPAGVAGGQQAAACAHSATWRAQLIRRSARR